MTAIHWLNPISDSFTNATDWSGGAVPGAADDAILDAVGSNPYTVTSSAIELVSSIQTAANATLSVSSGFFSVSAGTGSGVNAGQIIVGAQATFATAGLITNSGVISLGSGAQGADWVLKGSTTLAGGGHLALSDSANNTLGGSLPKGTTLANVDNTISGAGRIAGKGFVLNNEAGGVIDASGTAALTISIGNPTTFENGNVVNSGLLEATGSGGLSLGPGVLFNRGAGVILAGAGSTVRMDGAVVSYGRFETTGTGAIVANSGSIDSASIFGNFEVHQITAAGIIQNHTTIQLDGSLACYTAVTLDGHGSIDLGPAGQIRASGITVSGSPNELINVDNTILGAGIIDPVILVNEAAGIINANGPGNLDIGGSQGGVENAGHIKATGSGGITISSAISNTGTISAVGDTITVTGSMSSSGLVTLNAATFNFEAGFTGNVQFKGKNTCLLTLAQSAAYRGTLIGFSKHGLTSLDLKDIGFGGGTEATFSGSATSGTLTVTDQVNTATFTLKGDYQDCTFSVTSDGGKKGVIVVANITSPIQRPPHALIAAMASHGGSAGEAIHLGQAWTAREVALARPHAIA